MQSLSRFHNSMKIVNAEDISKDHISIKEQHTNIDKILEIINVPNLIN